MKKICLFNILILLFISFKCLNSQIIINEILASNFKSLFDEDYDEPDWIELYNNSYQAINLGGYRISDKKDFSKAWILPDTIIQPNSFYLLYADDKNRRTSEKYIIEASGVGITADVKKDGFRFHYLVFDGDFDISVRIHSVSGMYEFGKSGLIVREQLTDDSRYAGIFVLHPSRNLFSFLERLEPNTCPQTRIHFKNQDFPYIWLRLKREGDSLSAFVKSDGYNWVENYKGISLLPSKVYVGIAVSACDPNNKMYAKLSFSELLLYGKPFEFENLKVIEFNTSIKGNSYYSKEPHTNFKLSAEGEKVFLWDNKGQLVDSLLFGKQITNVSYGRYPDGSNNLEYMTQLTPSKPNTNGYKYIAENVNVEPQSGFYDTSFVAILKYKSDSAQIYYTTNTRTPDTTSNLSTNDIIDINKTTLFRAKLYENNKLSNRTASRTYFLNERFYLPVVSIIADSFDLWDSTKGLFINKNLYSRIEIPVHLDFFERKGEVSYSTDAGMRLHGQATRIDIPQKSLRFYSRNLYDEDSFNYPFWGKSEVKKTDKFILRNSGQDWYKSMLRDGFCNVLGQKMNNCISLYYRPVVVYINGEYCGLYNLRERFDEDYIADRYNVSPTSVNYVEDNVLKNGSSISFYKAVENLLVSDICDSSNYENFKNIIDIDNLIDYLIIRIFTASYDWPYQNNKFWNSSQFDGKWRWILHDFDLSLGFNDAIPEKNMFEHIRNNDCLLSQMTLKLFQNDKFKIDFISRFADYMNSIFIPEETIPILDSLANNIRSEIPFHTAKWEGSASNWEKQIDTIRNFLINRSESIYKHISLFFNLSGETVLILSSNIGDACSFEVNSLKIDNSRWFGKYFKDIPIRIKCKAKEGYKFVRWENLSSRKLETCLTTQLDTLRLKAVLVKSDIIADSGLVINEIMYNPSIERNCGDWFELYNPSDNPVDLTNWWFETESTDKLQIKENTVMMPNEYLIISNNDTLFRSLYKIAGAFIINESFNLSGNDYIKLYDNKLILKDFVDYSNSLPWDVNADGNGYSLELINPYIDNKLPSHWKASDVIGGTPWQQNSIFVGTLEKEINSYIPKIYPNPAKDKIYINFKQNLFENISFSIYNLLGEEVLNSQRNLSLSISQNYITIDISSLVNGTYLLKIYSESEPQKVIILLLFVL